MKTDGRDSCRLPDRLLEGWPRPDAFHVPARHGQGYKHLDVQSLHATLTGFDALGASVHERSARLLSTLIVSHPFPNANHRTSLDLVRYYIASHGIQWPYELRGRGRLRLHSDTKPFFIESKYLLQLVRHRALVQAALEHGYATLQIGPNAQRTIDGNDFDLRAKEVQRRHRTLCLRTIVGLGPAGLHDRLRQIAPKTLSQWAAWLD